jgi:hypothetical protein
LCAEHKCLPLLMQNDIEDQLNLGMNPLIMLAEHGREDQETAVLRPWGNLPLVAVQTIAQHLPASCKTALRLVCKAWRDAVACQFKQTYFGPGAMHLQPYLTPADGNSLQLAFPALNTVHFTTSSSREYSDTYHQVCKPAILPGCSSQDSGAFKIDRNHVYGPDPR